MRMVDRVRDRPGHSGRVNRESAGRKSGSTMTWDGIAIGGRITREADSNDVELD